MHKFRLRVLEMQVNPKQRRQGRVFWEKWQYGTTEGLGDDASKFQLLCLADWVARTLVYDRKV